MQHDLICYFGVSGIDFTVRGINIIHVWSLPKGFHVYEISWYILIYWEVKLRNNVLLKEDVQTQKLKSNILAVMKNCRHASAYHVDPQRGVFFVTNTYFAPLWVRVHLHKLVIKKCLKTFFNKKYLSGVWIYLYRTFTINLIKSELSSDFGIKHQVLKLKSYIHVCFKPGFNMISCLNYYLTYSVYLFYFTTSKHP